MISNMTNIPQNLSYNQTLNSGGNWTMPGNFDGMPPMHNSQWNPSWMNRQFPTGGWMNQEFTSFPWTQSDLGSFTVEPSTSSWFTAPITSQSSMFSGSHSSEMNTGFGGKFGIGGTEWPNAGFRMPTNGTLGLASVRFLDKDTETVIEIHAPGFMTETAEVCAIANEIRIRFFGTGDDKTQNSPMKLTLPLPTFGDGQQIQATAVNDFMRITVATRKEIASTIKKIKPSKFK